ncbi:hypothetical protein NPS53_09055 [Pseudomonas putida]|uniref:hypothetical protein n=1 Tax=Pseudomonas putida TaxID=303 RepID=UPI0023634FF9|nr:hypothetical protein [Pseudomonas putida]MDD2139723.1 hypothetical protein [Pseudomonas putida]HDS1721647.1 hypothetical protein [Pseudomonas putida]
MIFKRFDYQHPPVEGMYWIEFSIPETDCDAGDDGQPVGWYTGETIRRIGLIYIENIQDNGLPFMAMPVDHELCNFDGEIALIHCYAPVEDPDLPEDSPAEAGWIDHFGNLNDARLDSATWFWVAIKNEAEQRRYVTLARHEIYDGQPVPGFESPERTYFPTEVLSAGDIVTHFAPVTIPTLPVKVEPEVILASREELVGDVMGLSAALLSLYQIGTGQTPHLRRGKCPGDTANILARDDECVACINLRHADDSLAAAGLVNTTKTDYQSEINLV